MVSIWVNRIDYSFPLELFKFFDRLTVKTKIVTVPGGFLMHVDVICKTRILRGRVKVPM